MYFPRKTFHADIVFVHGLLGGAVKTWRQDNKKDKSCSECWPKVRSYSTTAFCDFTLKCLMSSSFFLSLACPLNMRIACLHVQFSCSLNYIF